MHLELPSEIQCPGREEALRAALRRKGNPFLRDLRRIQLIITPSHDEEKVQEIVKVVDVIGFKHS